MSSCASPTERISTFVDFHLSPLARKIPSYNKDTADILKKLEGLGSLPSGTILTTLDGSFLYTNSPHNDGIEACRVMLITREVLHPPTDDLIHLIKLVLTKNNFTFNHEQYLQIHGTAIYGNKDGSSECQYFYGQAREPATTTSNLHTRRIVEVYR